MTSFPLKIIIPISLVVIILIIVLWYLYAKKKEIYSKIIYEKKRFERYKQGIQNLKQNSKNPEKDFKALNKYIRTFFKEYLELGQNKTYLELANDFKKQGKTDYVSLCNLMTNMNYKGQKTAKNITNAINLFEKIINNF